MSAGHIYVAMGGGRGAGPATLPPAPHERAAHLPHRHGPRNGPLVEEGRREWRRSPSGNHKSVIDVVIFLPEINGTMS